MSTRTVEWAAPRAEGLRERKKRLMRQHLSDTATEMFMERGFEAVRVIEVAEACGVSEKTVYNYFPTKESLILDRWDTTMAELRTGLAAPHVTPIDAALRILAGELGGMLSWLAAQDDPARAAGEIQRFGAMIRATPALRAHQRDATERLIAVAAEILADRAALRPDDPEPQIAAIALLGLWNTQFQALRRYLDGARTPEQVGDAVTAEVLRAARVITSGLAIFAPKPA